MSVIEVGMGIYMLGCMYLAADVADDSFISAASIPFLGIFAFGYLYVGISSLWNQIASRSVPRVAPTPA
jgi:hypothetical protein